MTRRRTQDQKEPGDKRQLQPETGIAAGVAIGVGVGVALGNIAIGIGVGFVFAAGFATRLAGRKK